LTVVVAQCTYGTVPASVASRTVGGLLLLGRWWCWWGVGRRCRVTFVMVFWLPFILSGRPSLCALSQPPPRRRFLVGSVL